MFKKIRDLLRSLKFDFSMRSTSFGPPEILSTGKRTKSSPEEYIQANTDAVILDVPVKIIAVGQRRVRGSAYALTLEETLEDFAQRLLDDDDLEEAVYLLTQYAKSKGYQFDGTAQQVLTKLHRYAETRK